MYVHSSPASDLSHSPSGLFSVTIRQALFIAPCSHAFHYKCIRPLLEKHATAFSCPLCRSFADLDEDVEVEQEAEDEDEDEDVEWEDVASAPPPVATTISARHLASPPPLARDGAETEVETDLLGNEHRSSRRPRPSVRTDGHIMIPPMDPLMDLSEHIDFDAVMLDADAEGGDADDADSENLDRLIASGYIRRANGFGLHFIGNSSGAQDVGSEGYRSPSASAEGGGLVVHGSIISGAEPVISGKRKR